MARVATGQCQQLQRRQLVEERGAESGSLSDRDDDLVGLQATHQGALVREGISVHVDAGPAAEPLPVWKGENNALVVVEDRDPLHDVFAAGSGNVSAAPRIRSSIV